MLHTLDCELRRKKQKPIPAIMAATGCSQKTAYNKLHGISSFTVQEVFKIIDAYFPDDADDNVSIKALFAREQDSA